MIRCFYCLGIDHVQPSRCVSFIRVFVFIDPAVFPLSLVNALKAEVECGDAVGDPLMYKRRILLHTLLAGLGKQCQVDRLTQALEVCACFKSFVEHHCIHDPPKLRIYIIYGSKIRRHHEIIIQKWLHTHRKHLKCVKIICVKIKGQNMYT